MKQIKLSVILHATEDGKLDVEMELPNKVKDLVEALAVLHKHLNKSGLNDVWMDISEISDGMIEMPKDAKPIPRD